MDPAWDAHHYFYFVHLLSGHFQNAKNEFLFLFDRSAGLKTPSAVEGSSNEENFRKLETEIQEEHANYRKLVLQQQKQYDER